MRWKTRVGSDALSIADRFLGMPASILFSVPRQSYQRRRRHAAALTTRRCKALALGCPLGARSGSASHLPLLPQRKRQPVKHILRDQPSTGEMPMAFDVYDFRDVNKNVLVTPHIRARLYHAGTGRRRHSPGPRGLPHPRGQGRVHDRRPCRSVGSGTCAWPWPTRSIRCAICCRTDERSCSCRLRPISSRRIPGATLTAAHMPPVSSQQLL